MAEQLADPDCGAVIAQLEVLGGGSVELRNSTLGAAAGLGVFAARDFAADEPITRYEGELVEYAEARRRRARDEASHLRKHIPLTWTIDGTRLADGTRITRPAVELRGAGIGAFCNHSRAAANAVFDFVDCAPNARLLRAIDRGRVVGASELDPRERVSYIRAARAIRAGEEVFVDYGDDYWAGQRPLARATELARR